MLNFKLNGKNVSVKTHSEASLLTVLTENLHVAGAKYGCGKSQCGACVVIVDGARVVSCTTPAKSVVGRSVTTLEGLLENGKPNPLQKAFIEEQAAQCGYCTSGMIMTAQTILDNNPNPTEAEVRAGMNGNLCRCGTQNRVIKAILRAAKEA